MNAPAKMESNPLAKLSHQLEERAASYAVALPSHIKPADLQRTVVMAAQQNAKLLECDRRSLMLACMKSAQDGLLPDGREAALVPFSVWDKSTRSKRWEVVYMPMVYGVRKKIMQSGEISTMSVGVVYLAEYESGRFLFEEGLEPPVRYKPDLTLSIDDTNDDKIVAAYSMVKFKDGSWSADVMRRAEIDKIRELSQTGATKNFKGEDRKPSGPWVDHFSEMAKKTVMRRHAKVLPASGDIFRDVEAEDQRIASVSAAALLDGSTAQQAAQAAEEHADEPGQEQAALPDASEQQDNGVPIESEGAEREPAEVDCSASGMSEVDEETARKLDNAEDPAAVEEEAPVWESFFDETKAAVDACSDLEALKQAETEYDKARATLPDEKAAIADGWFRDMRAALKRKEKAGK